MCDISLWHWIDTERTMLLRRDVVEYTGTWGMPPYLTEMLIFFIFSSSSFKHWIVELVPQALAFALLWGKKVASVEKPIH